MKTRQEMLNASLKTRRKSAEERRAKVRDLKEKGLSGPQIAAELGLKIRTVYYDFGILKKQQEQQQNNAQ